MKRIFLILVLALPLSGCGDPKGAIEAQGFSEVKLDSGLVWFGCSDDDEPFYNTKFTAIAANGRPINGVACGGMLKGWTVRTF